MTLLFHRVRVARDVPEIDDVRAHTDHALAASGVAIPVGDEVAIAVGSRGIADLVTVVRAVIAWVRAQGGVPFIVPAMGSHGGATGPGQAAVLASYGVTEAALGCEVRSSMDVVSLGADIDTGFGKVPLVMDAHAARASAVIVVNRVKPHTDFHGPFESGLMKMAAIGLGKQVAAEAIHAHGVRGLRDVMPAVARGVLASGRILLGVAIVENAREGTADVVAVPGDAIPDVEPGLLVRAGVLIARLPVDRLDVLLIDRMGKDVSGVGMDTNVIGRLMIRGQNDPPTPDIAMIGCHALTPASHGNATGVGLADVITRRLADQIDHDATRTNIVTSGFLLRGKLPVIADSDAQLWELCLRGAGVVDVAGARAARIVDTLHCDDLWLSDASLADARAAGLTLDVLASGLRLHDVGGDLSRFP